MPFLCQIIEFKYIGFMFLSHPKSIRITTVNENYVLPLNLIVLHYSIYMVRNPDVNKSIVKQIPSYVCSFDPALLSLLTIRMKTATSF